MRILVCGANGFIGRAIAGRLTQGGHTVLRGVREARASDEVSIDFSRDLASGDWLPRLERIDAVVNAVGILVERPGQTFDKVHRAAPCALFAACAMAGVRRVVQISALGTERGDTGYFTSKLAAEECLRKSALEWQIVRPALMYGVDGASARFFRLLASLPLVGLPGGGGQMLQPAHIDDLCEAVFTLLEPATPPRQCVELTGARAVTYRDMLASYRRGMGFAPALEISIPARMVAWTAAVGSLLPGSILTRDTWKMMQAGNCADTAATAALLGRPPRDIAGFVAPGQSGPLRQQALAAWRGPLLRGALAAVWGVTGLISLFAYPLADSLALLARVGIGGAWGPAALYCAAGLDLLFAAATVLRPSRRLWLAQGATVLLYSAIIAWALPEFLVHPFGPLLKNLPLLAILFVLVAEES